MEFSSVSATVVRGPDGLLYEVSPAATRLLGKLENGCGNPGPATAGLGLYGVSEHRSTRAMIECEDHASSRAMIDDSPAARAMIDCEDHTSTRAMIEAQDLPASRAMIDADDAVASCAMLEAGDHRSSRAMITPKD